MEYPSVHKEKQADTFEEVLQRRVARRSLIKGALASLPLVVLKTEPGRVEPAEAQAAALDGLTFTPITLRNDDFVSVPPGYKADVLIRWGDPLSASAPDFDPNNLTAAAQAQQFGYNCDYLGYFDLPFNRGLLVVNHEYTNPELMFPGYTNANPTQQQVDYEIATHGVSVVEVQPVAISQQAFRWVYNRNSPFNRRVTGETQMEITGPAAGHRLMRTSEDPSGTKVRGTFNNCGGGMTPWGTFLTAEENFDQYFANNDSLIDSDIKTLNQRFGIPRGASGRKWERYHKRFDLSQEPNESHRFGWMVEIDPYNPSFVPRKRTALGRFKHEAASIVATKDDRVAVYSGDDARFEFLYKFVSDNTYDRRNRNANFDVLDSGTLYVAKFNDDGSGEWLPLVFGEGPLMPFNGFADQGEVLIKSRAAATALGATPMDRPEDVEANPVNGKVYMALTNNTARAAATVDAANPRANNRWGHVIEITPGEGDHGTETFTWEIFMLCGDPADATQGTFFAGFNSSMVSPIACPDNLTFDRRGNLWIATDGQPNVLPGNDAVFAVPTAGSDRGFVRQFFSGVIGAEVASLIFNSQNTTLFTSIQHPGEGGTLANPESNFPDGRQPCRPSVMAVTKTAGPDYRIGT
jgi:secreted PhoX family phosphatase